MSTAYEATRMGGTVPAERSLQESLTLPLLHSTGLDLQPTLFLPPLQGPRLRAYRVLGIKDAGPKESTYFI